MRKITAAVIFLLLAGCNDLFDVRFGSDWNRCPPTSDKIIGYECGTSKNNSGRMWPLPTNFHDSLRTNTNYQDSLCNVQAGMVFISWVCE